MLIGLGLLAGAAWLYFRPGAQQQLLGGFQQLQDAFTGAAQQARLQEQQALQLAMQERQRQQAIAGTAVGGAGAAASAAFGAASLATAGIAAGASLLAWGIIDQGWFRGGWEGVTGNALRDRFINQFVAVYFPGSGSERQFDAMVRALESIGIAGEPARQMIERLYLADSAAEMQAAIGEWASAFRAKGINIAVPENY